MPYLGADWRSPGQKWIKTEFGWKTISDALCSQIMNQLRHLSPIGRASNSSSRSSRRSSCHDDGSSWIVKPNDFGSPDPPPIVVGDEGESCFKVGAIVVEKKTPSVSVASRSIATDSNSGNSLAADHLKYLRHVLSMRCISIGKSGSRESNHYSTISDAVHKLNFQNALLDQNCFPFICKVLCLIFECYYQSSSGSLRMTMFRLIEAAKELALDTRMHITLVIQMVNKAISANEIVRREQISSFSIHNVDSKIKSLLRMKRRLEDSEKELGGSSSKQSAIQLLHLPDDCLQYIISFLTHPKDVLNLGETNVRLCVLTEGGHVWRELTCYHYGQDASNVDEDEFTSWMDTFIDHYRLSQKKLRMDWSFSACLCKICNFVYWKSYGHPCCGNPVAAAAIAELHSPITEELSPQYFMNLFV